MASCGPDGLCGLCPKKYAHLNLVMKQDRDCSECYCIHWLTI